MTDVSQAPLLMIANLEALVALLQEENHRLKLKVVELQIARHPETGTGSTP